MITENIKKIKRHIPEIELLLKTKLQEKSPSTSQATSPLDVDEKTEVICIYGIGEGLDYFPLQSWLEEEKHYLVFLEEDVDSIRSFLNSKQAQKILEDKKVRFFFFESLLSVEETIKKIAWEYIFLSMQFFIHPSNQGKKQAEWIEQVFSEITQGCFLIGSDYSDFGVHVIGNVVSNFLCQKNLLRLEKQRTACPALICGAGASIEKIQNDFSILKEKCLVFAGGAAMSVLSSWNQSPHFGGMIDKEGVVQSFIDSMHFPTPFFFQSRASFDCMYKVHGEKIVSFDLHEYLYRNWVEDREKQQENRLESGWSVVSYLLELALFLGCDPIIFSGVDLCLNAEEFYAKGVHERAIQIKENTPLIQKINAKGKVVYTQNDWAFTAKYIQNITTKFSKKSFFSLSEGLSLGESVKDASISTLSNLPQRDFSAIAHNLVQNMSHVEMEKTQNLPNEIENLLRDTQEKLESLLKKIEEKYPVQLKECLFEEKMHNDWGYKYVFIPLWPIFKGRLEQMPVHSYPLLAKIIFLQDVMQQHRTLMQKIKNERKHIPN